MEKIENYELEYDIEKSTFIIETEKFLTNKYQSYHTFKDIDDSIKRFGNYESPFSPIYGGNKCYFYNARLAFFLTSDFLHPATNIGFGNRFYKIRGRNYYKYYEKAFYEGKKYFLENFYVPINKAYDFPYSRVIARILDLCTIRESSHEVFHAKKGWFNEALSDVYYISTYHVANAGFYSGLLNGYNKMQNETGVFNFHDLNLTDPKMFENELKRLESSKNEFCHMISMKRTIEIFLPLTKNHGKRQHIYLDEMQFILFMRKAFLNISEINKVEIKMCSGKIGYFISFFYQFYKECRDLGHINKKEPFIKLVEQTFTNFSYSQIKYYLHPNKVLRKQ